MIKTYRPIWEEHPVATVGVAAVLGAGLYWLMRPRGVSVPGPFVIQTVRPLPSEMSQTNPAEVSRIIRISQAQLQALGYHVTSIDGISGPETQTAGAAFIRDHLAEIQALGARLGRQDDGVSLMVLDDVYRQRFGLPAAAAGALRPAGQKASPMSSKFGGSIHVGSTGFGPNSRWVLPRVDNPMPDNPLAPYGMSCAHWMSMSADQQYQAILGLLPWPDSQDAQIAQAAYINTMIGIINNYCSNSGFRPARP